MTPSTVHLLPWRRLPAYAVNGIAVALGIGLIQLVFAGAVGAGAAQLVVSGATCASLPDLPNVVDRTWRRVAVAALLSVVAALCVDLVRPHSLALGVVVAAIGFGAMMVMSYGARAGPVAFAPVLSTIFSMAVPASGHPFAVAGWSACGGIAYLAWSAASGAALQARYRTLALANAVAAVADLFRSRASVLESRRRRDGATAPLRAWIRGEGVLAERLQAARDLVFPATASARWQRDSAILLSAIELRDLLFASPLDIELLGSDDTARSILTDVADALNEIGARIDALADRIRHGTAAPAAAPPRIDFAARFADIPVAPADARARLVPALSRRQQRIADEVTHLDRLVGARDVEPLPLTAAQLQRFVSGEGWGLRMLRSHWQLDSLVLRHAIRMGLALGAAYYIALALPWGSHPYWLVLSVAVVLRGTLGDTLARRNARVGGTLLGCSVVVVLSALPSLDFQRALYLAALGTAHAYAAQRYWLTATAASVMALLQSSLVNPGNEALAIVERAADTVIGALLAWCFSYVLPSWERRVAHLLVAALLANLRSYAAYSLRAKPGDPVEERLLRRKAYDSLASLGGALQRSGVEPERVRLPLDDIATLLDRAARLMAHLSVVRLLVAQVDGSPDAAKVGTMASAAHATLDRALDLAANPPPSDEAAAGQDPDALPEQPPAHDVLPWLARRLALLVREAARVRAAVDSSGLAGARD